MHNFKQIIVHPHIQLHQVLYPLALPPCRSRMNIIIIDFPEKNSSIFKSSMHHATCKRNTLGFLFSGPADMGNAQGELSSLVLVREGGDRAETDDLWSDIELSDFPSLGRQGKIWVQGRGTEPVCFVGGLARGRAEDPRWGREAELELGDGGWGVE